MAFAIDDFYLSKSSRMDDLVLASRWVLESSGHVIIFITVINIVEEAYSFLRGLNLSGLGL